MVSSASSSTSESALSPAPSDQVDASATVNVSSPPATDTASTEIPRQQPIPPASEPMQYRAIGLVHGKYIASEEQFTRGQLVTDEDLQIDAVLLGRVMSLVKKHLDLEQPHLWVVYPRTRSNDNQLHLQIVGVWEPENLNKDSLDIAISSEIEDGEDEVSEDEMPDQAIASQADETHTDVRPNEDEANTENTRNIESAAAEISAENGLSISADEVSSSESAESTSSDVEEAPTAHAPDAPAHTSMTQESDSATSPTLLARPTQKSDPQPAQSSQPASQTTAFQPVIQDGYFSIRGEVIKQSKEENLIKVKIRQAPRRNTKQMKTFNLTLLGALDDKAVGYFWDLHAQRQGNDLVIEDATMIGLVPPTKRSKSKRPGQRGGSSRGNRGRFNKGGKPSRPPFKRDARSPRDSESQSTSGSESGGRPTSRPIKRRQQSDSQSTPE
jgi:hypothetical protein